MIYKEVLDVNNGKILAEMMSKGYKCKKVYNYYDVRYLVYENKDDIVVIEVMDNHVASATKCIKIGE